MCTMYSGKKWLPFQELKTEVKTDEITMKIILLTSYAQFEG